MYTKSELSVGKALQKRRCQGHMMAHIYNFDARDHIPGTAKARVANVCIQFVGRRIYQVL